MTEELTMDTDALKAAMAALEGGDRELVFPGTVAARKARHGVDALAKWQVVQIGVGIVIALAGGMVWSDLLARPGLLFASGLLVNLFGAAMIALGIAGLTHACGSTSPLLSSKPKSMWPGCIGSSWHRAGCSA